jgi:Uncharacterized protein conserved in bacteria
MTIQNLFSLKYIAILFVSLVISNLTFAMEHNHSMHHQSTSLEVHNPWVRSAPPNAPMLGAFMQIKNNTNNTIKLLSAQAKGYQRVELHRTLNHGGMMKMLKQDFMPIEANNNLHLKPGSWHIMLIEPGSVPEEGDMVMIKLTFDNGFTQTIRAIVRKGK